MCEQRHETTVVVPSAIWSVEASTCGGRIADHRTIGGGGGGGGGADRAARGGAGGRETTEECMRGQN
jgi:hypothetical protein